MPAIRNDWTLDEVFKQFETSEADIEGVTLLFSIDDGQCYEGFAFILFERGGKLFEVLGSHCSCNGYEGQWDPEETTFEAIRHRIDAAAKFSSMREYETDIRAFLDLAEPIARAAKGA